MRRTQTCRGGARVAGLGLGLVGLAAVASVASGGRGSPQLSFIAERAGSRDVYVIASDGSAERLVVGGPRDESNGPSTPDGTQLIIAVAELPAGSVGSKALSPSAEPQRAFHYRLVPVPPPGGMAAVDRPRAPLAIAPPLFAGRAVLRSPSFLPDGRQLIFESEPQAQQGLRELFALRLQANARPALRQLTSNPEGNFWPTVCGASGYIAFTSSRDRSSQLYRMRTDGSELRRLTYVGGSKWAPRCATTPEQIFFTSDHEGADRIYSIHRNGSTPKRLTGRSPDPSLVEDELSLADDGVHLAYTLRRPGGRSSVFIVDLQRRSECEVPLPPLATAKEPDWSPRLPGGPLLALTVELADDGPRPSEKPTHRTAQIWLSNARCGETRRLTSQPGPNWHPLWLRK